MFTPEEILNHKLDKLLQYIDEELYTQYGLKRVPIWIDVRDYGLDALACEILKENLQKSGWTITNIGHLYNFIEVGEAETDMVD